MIERTFMIVAVLLLTACGDDDVSIAARSPSRQALAEVLPRFQVAWNRGDLEAIARMVHPDHGLHALLADSPDEAHAGWRKVTEKYGEMVSFEFSVRSEEVFEDKREILVDFTWSKGRKNDHDVTMRQTADGAWALADVKMFD